MRAKTRIVPIVVGVLAVGWCLALPGSGGSRAATAATGAHAYVALGDSYTAGPLINLDFQQRYVPVGCAQSKYSYPYLVAAALRVQQFRDPSCSASETGDFAKAQSVPDGTNPPEYDALGPDTSLVTVGIGGNDIGLVGLAVGCINLLPIPLAPPPFGTTCASSYLSGGADVYGSKIVAFYPKMVSVLQTIARKAPNAKVFVVGYPAVLPQGPGCWPYVPLLPADNAYVRDKVQQLNYVLALASAATHSTYVDTWTSSVGHDACKLVGTNWVDGVVVLPLAFPLHPNQQGEANTAGVVAQAVRASGWKP